MRKVEYRLKELRLESGFTQWQVAEKIGVSRVVYNRYEKERRNIPIEVLWALADLYQTDIDYLVGRED